jgi:hypothetical protein
MSKKIIPFIAVLTIFFAVSACTQKMKMEPAYQVGHYRVTEFIIKPSTSEMANEPGYIELKSQLTKLLQEKLVNKGESPPDVQLTIQIQEVNLSKGTAKTILVGDNFRISSKIQLNDVRTGAPVGSGQMIRVTAPTGGLTGLAADLVISEQWQKEQLIKHYVEDLSTLLYTGEVMN